ncbi:MAG TPA: Rne/Rng family ribonuclease [Clostridiaceae bacterium]|jgi:ribonuclease G|nr:Rne/Rng family ribonuclease [Clostridia bacterium]HJJ11861.1 Rne/Rng family ribonuclease [Clostridiaceae bacterium]
MQELRIKVDTNEKSVILLNDYKIVEQYTINKENIEGNIYLGTIKNIIPGLKAVFVDIGKTKNAFIHYEDLGKTKNEIKLNEKILVQVQKNAVKQKGAKLTTNIKLIGRQIVLMPKKDFISVSRKIEDEGKREELKEIVKKYLPINCGAIIRTNCIFANEEEIRQDIQMLTARWNNIKNSIEKNMKNVPCIIEEDNSIVKSLILATVDSKMSKITTNSKEYNEEILNFLKLYKLENIIKIELDNNVFEKYTIEKELQSLENNKVWLNCGGQIVIDKTEALTAIDVNSGKCIGKDSLEETILKVNIEAAKEIAKQIRLRDIGGIVIVDFIDMEKENSKEKLLKSMEEEIKKDRAKVQIEGFSKLNLLEFTRKQLYGKE